MLLDAAATLNASARTLGMSSLPLMRNGMGPLSMIPHCLKKTERSAGRSLALHRAPATEMLAGSSQPGCPRTPWVHTWPPAALPAFVWPWLLRSASELRRSSIHV